MGKCKYNSSWELNYDWVCSIPGEKFSARCKCCMKTFSVHSGGVGHLESHEKGDSHKRNYKRWSAKKDPLINFSII